MDKGIDGTSYRFGPSVIHNLIIFKSSIFNSALKKYLVTRFNLKLFKPAQKDQSTEFILFVSSSKNFWLSVISLWSMNE